MDAWASRRAIAKTAENEASGKTALFRRGKPVTTDWAYFSELAQARDGRKVTPRRTDNVDLKVRQSGRYRCRPRWQRSGRTRPLAGHGCRTRSRDHRKSRQGVIPTNRPTPPPAIDSNERDDSGRSGRYSLQMNPRPASGARGW